MKAVGEAVRAVYAIFKVPVFPRCGKLSLELFFLCGFISKCLFNIYGRVNKTSIQEGFAQRAAGLLGSRRLGLFAAIQMMKSSSGECHAECEE